MLMLLPYRRKMKKKWREAAEFYVQAGQSYIREKKENQAALSYANAAKCYEQDNTDPYDVLVSILHAVKLYRLQHKYLLCADFQVRAAEIQENLKLWDGAYEAYKNSAELYQQQSYNSKAHHCYLKSGEIVSLYLTQFEEAAELFENAAAIANSEVLLKCRTSSDLFQAGLCYLASDVFTIPPIRAKLDMYMAQYSGFSESIESQLFRKLILSTEKLNREEFDNIKSSIENDWKLKLLQSIEKIRFMETN